MKELALQLRPTAVPYSDIERMATALATSKLFGVRDPSQAIALCLVAQAEGMHPAIAARDYDIIQGKPSKKAEAIQRSFMAAGGMIEWHQLDDQVADATFSHPQGGKFRCRWDMDRAKRAELSGRDIWRKYPRAMLRARCISEGCRTIYPGSTSGMYTPEEIRDMQDEKEIAGVTIQTEVEKPAAKVASVIAEVITPEQLKELRACIADHDLTEDVILNSKTLKEWGVSNLADLTEPQANRIKGNLQKIAIFSLNKRIDTMKVAELTAIVKEPPFYLGDAMAAIVSKANARLEEMVKALESDNE